MLLGLISKCFHHIESLISQCFSYPTRRRKVKSFSVEEKCINFPPSFQAPNGSCFGGTQIEHYTKENNRQFSFFLLLFNRLFFLLIFLFFYLFLCVFLLFALLFFFHILLILETSNGALL